MRDPVRFKHGSKTVAAERANQRRSELAEVVAGVLLPGEAAPKRAPVDMSTGARHARVARVVEALRAERAYHGRPLSWNSEPPVSHVLVWLKAGR